MNDRMTAVELAKLRGRKQWKEHDAHRVLSALRGSGLSVNAFARHHGLGRERVRWWGSRLAEWQRAAQESPSLIPVVPVALPESRAQVVIRLPDGMVVEVADTSAVEAEWTSRVVSRLARTR